MALAAGTTLGPYEILSLIGAGGMGEVYLARDPRLNREVAIKVLPADRVGEENAALDVLSIRATGRFKVVHGRHVAPSDDVFSGVASTPDPRSHRPSPRA